MKLKQCQRSLTRMKRSAYYLALKVSVWPMKKTVPESAWKLTCEVSSDLSDATWRFPRPVSQRQAQSHLKKGVLSTKSSKEKRKKKNISHLTSSNRSCHSELSAEAKKNENKSLPQSKTRSAMVSPWFWKVVVQCRTYVRTYLPTFLILWWCLPCWLYLDLVCCALFITYLRVGRLSNFTYYLLEAAWTTECYITQYRTLRSIALHSTTKAVHCITSAYSPRHYNTVQYSAVHNDMKVVLQDATSHNTGHCVTLHCITLQNFALH